MEKQEILNDIIRNRRSLYPKQYSDQEIDNAVIEKILENASWAPTHKLTQPWQFTVFKGDGRKKLAEFQSELYKQKTMEKGTFKEEKYKSMKEKPLMASHIIAVAMIKDPQERLPVIEEISAVACAVQNMYLTAHAYGLGAYWGTGGVTYFPETKAFFKLEEKDEFMGFFYLGIPQKEYEINSRRIPVSEKTKWIMN